MLPLSETVAAPDVNMSDSSLNANMIVLSPGHSRTIFYELHDTVYNDVNAVHTAFIMTVGSGVLTVSVANSTSMGEGSEIIYATSGVYRFRTCA